VANSDALLSKDNIPKIETGLTFLNDLSMEDTIDQVKQLSQGSTFSYVVTPNIDHMARLCDDSLGDDLMEVYRNADMSLCDSRILHKFLLFCGKKIKEVIPGSELTLQLFNRVLNERDTILIFGSEPEDINFLRQLYPLLNIHHINPSMGFINNPEEVSILVDKVTDIGADYIFIAVGSPRQEVFANKLKLSGGLNGVGLCIGASINFLVGKEKRAPAWVQKMHVEWFYRMLGDPKRLVNRYVSNAISLLKIYPKLK